MTKLEIAIKIATARLGLKVDENNWKVKSLMQHSKSDLGYFLNLAPLIDILIQNNLK